MTPTTPRYAFDAKTATFEQDVLLRSLEVPVLVDFWADWCAPCKQLKPILEKLAEEFAGGFILAKVNSDEEGQLASVFGVRSLPTVILLKGGRPVDGFMGALPEAQVRQFLTQHGVLPGVAEPEEIIEEPVLTAEQKIAELETQIAAEPDKPELQLDLAVELARVGDTTRAEKLLDALPAKLAVDDRAKKVRATLGFAQALQGAPTLGQLEHRVAHDGADLDARHLLGVHYLVGGDAEGAFEQFLEMLRQDKQWKEGLPRKLLIDAFNVVEDADLVGRYRRRMSSMLF